MPKILKLVDQRRSYSVLHQWCFCDTVCIYIVITYICRVNGRFPGEPGLASFPILFIHLFQNRTFGDTCYRLFMNVLPVTEPTVNAQEECQSIDFYQ